MLTKAPIQPAGWVVFGVGVASLLGAFALNWRELLVLAIGCAAILIVSLLFIVGRSDIRLTRSVIPDRVTVGEPAIVELHAVNRSSSRSPRQTIMESVDGELVPIILPSLKSGGESTQTYDPPTHRRGLHKLGPGRITKADPCRLMQRDVSQTKIDELWVQPRVVPLPAFAGGLAKDIDGPTFDHSPAGDVAFHAIRPYQPGDDARHVHWMATARAGEMMVRHYVDNRQPYLSVLIDTNETSWASIDEFDRAIDVAASLGLAALSRSHPVSVHAGETALVGRQFRSTRQQLLDDLTIAQTDSTYDLGYSMSRLVAAERNTSIAVLLTGTRKALNELAPSSAKLATTCPVVLVRVGDADVASSDNEMADAENIVVGRGVRFIEVADVDDLAAIVAQRFVAV